jgi:hypothetical protein
MTIEPKPKTRLCEWCEQEEPHRWFGGWWICLTCDRDFFARNGRAEKAQAWLRSRGNYTRLSALRRTLHYRDNR